MNIHKQLKRIRKSAGITQAELAKLSNATQKQVSLIEGGKDCYISTMRAMLKAMGYDLVAVLEDEAEGGELGD
jgi:predicted transcriptional regulator